MTEYGMTQEEAAGRVGKSRPAVANALRLLNLPDDMLKALAEGRITAGHARALLALNDPEKIVIVQTAPAVRAALGEEFGMPIGSLVTGKMVAALKQMGFYRVYDTNFGAIIYVTNFAVIIFISVYFFRF
mgnify:CR=1 FL=1